MCFSDHSSQWMMKQIKWHITLWCLHIGVHPIYVKGLQIRGHSFCANIFPLFIHTFNSQPAIKKRKMHSKRNWFLRFTQHFNAQIYTCDWKVEVDFQFVPRCLTVLHVLKCCEDVSLKQFVLDNLFFDCRSASKFHLFLSCPFEHKFGHFQYSHISHNWKVPV